MNGSLQSTAHQALSELLDVSPQVEFAVIVEPDGTPIASARRTGTSEDAMAGDFGTLVTRVLDQAERSRSELGRERVTQCEVSTGKGNLFVVTDGQRHVAAITESEPTVGLVFYDLKTALRTLRTSESPTSEPSSDGANV